MTDLPLQFHDFKHLDHTKRCPKYSAILSRPVTATVQPSELDDIFTDLETLLGAANIRHRQLESELKILGEWADKKDRKPGFELELLTNVSSGKKSGKSSIDERPSKKQRIDEAKSGKVKGKISNKVPKAEPDPEVYVSKPKPSADVPNKFWAAVEPYCADITSDDLKVLEDICNSVSEESEFFKVPSLGKHYTQVWAQEDLIEEQWEGSKTEKRRGTLTSNQENIDIEKKAKHVDANNLNNEDETCPFGALTQRLISALVDENILAPMDENDISDSAKSIGNDGAAVAVANPIKVFTIPHAKALENAIKDELVNLGLIESHSDEEDVDFDDEVFAVYSFLVKFPDSAKKHFLNSNNYTAIYISLPGHLPQ